MKISGRKMSPNNPGRLDRLDMKISPSEDGTPEPWLQVNGVKYTLTQYQWLVYTRQKEMDDKCLASKNFCSACKLPSCIANTVGEPRVVNFANALRGREEKFDSFRQKCFRMLLAQPAFLEYMNSMEQKQIPECVAYWVDIRCCIGCNW